MPNGVDPVARRVELAAEFAWLLSESDPDGAAVLFGSSARGDANEDSDLDLLMICTRRAGAPAAAGLRAAARPIKASILTHTWGSFDRLRTEDWLFVQHLREEALVLRDPHGEFTRRCDAGHPGDSAVIEEIRLHSRGLDHLGDVERYGSDFLFPLAGAFALAKRVVMLGNARHGVRIYSRDGAFKAGAELFPRAAEDLAMLRELEPFYSLTRGIRSAETPFPSDHAARKLLEHTAALRRVVESVCA